MFKLTYNQAISIDCPVNGCNAKAGEACNMKGDLLIVKQFKNVHYSRQTEVKELLYSKITNEPEKQIIKKNGIFRKELIATQE